MSGTIITATRNQRNFLIYGTDDVRESSGAMEPEAWFEGGEAISLAEARALIGEGHRLSDNLKAFVAVVETDPQPRWLDWQPNLKYERTGTVESGHVSYSHGFGIVHERKVLDDPKSNWAITVELIDDNVPAFLAIPVSEARRVLQVMVDNIMAGLPDDADSCGWCAADGHHEDNCIIPAALAVLESDDV
jgi:hypothetical protein